MSNFISSAMVPSFQKMCFGWAQLQTLMQPAAACVVGIRGMGPLLGGRHPGSSCSFKLNAEATEGTQHRLCLLALIA